MSISYAHPLFECTPVETPVRHSHLSFLNWVRKERKILSPVLLGGVLCRLLGNLGVLGRSFQLLSLPPYSGFAAKNGRFLFKHLTHDYLVRGMSVSDRADCFVHHHQRFYNAFSRRLLQQALHGEYPLVDLTSEASGDDHRYAITMGLSAPFDKEGEYSLNFQVNGENFVILSFTIVPGKAIQQLSAEVLLITRIQGMKGCYQQIRQATKNLHDVAPAHLLMSALLGLAETLEIPAFAGVSAERQCSYVPEAATSFRKAYDSFFDDLSLEKNSQGYYCSPIPMLPKPMEEVKTGHKIRTREKRALKERVQEACTSLLRSELRILPASASTGKIRTSFFHGEVIPS